jgi:hypothetical protein
MFTPGPLYPDNLLGRLMRLGSSLARESRPIDHLVSPIRRPLDRVWYLRTGRVRELTKLGESVANAAPPPGGKKVLVLSLRMWTNHTAYESVIAQALRLRGAEVAMLTCGGGQPICEVGWGRVNAPRPCDRCAYFTGRVARGGGFPWLRLADDLPWGSRPDRAPLEADTVKNLSQPDAALPSEAWFVRSADVARAPDGPAVTRDFEVSVAAVERAFGRIVDRFRPDVVFALNGLFAAERAVRVVGADRGVRVVTYELAPRKDALVFGETAAAPEMVMDALALDQCSRPLSEEEAAAVDALLEARVSGSSSHERYFDTQEHDADAVRKALGIPTGKRVVSSFTNLAWDTALFGNEVGYESQFDWLARTVEQVGRREDTVLIIRVHPAESRWGTAQPVETELAARVGELPDNVRLVRPDDPLSSYGLLAITNLALCYTTTVGLEAAVRGIPVAVAAKTHYRGRGFTVDLESPADLEAALADPPTMTPEQVELARRYAFAFFFRRMIPFRHVRVVGGWVVEVPTSAGQLLPGRDPYLDFICDRILNGGDLFLPSTLALPSAA